MVRGRGGRSRGAGHLANGPFRAVDDPEAGSADPMGPFTYGEGANRFPVEKTLNVTPAAGSCRRGNCWSRSRSPGVRG